jgi:hypothetical protein
MRGGYDAGMSTATAPEAAAYRVAAAFAALDTESYARAVQGLIDAFRSASPLDVQPALAPLEPVLTRIQFGAGVPLADVAGRMALVAPDPTPVFETLVERTCQVLEQAARFRALHRELLGRDAPPPDQLAALAPTMGRLREALGPRIDEAITFDQAWFAGADWVMSLLWSLQRADVRAALPQRGRLLVGLTAVMDAFEAAHAIYGLTVVLDDAPLLVFHRPTSRGFRFTVGGIADGRQLATLLAACLVPDHVPGTPPPQHMVEAAAEGQQQPPGGVVSQFDLRSGDDAPIPDDGWLADIPLIDGERVVILDQPRSERHWATGRLFNRMKPTISLVGELSTEEFWDYRAKLHHAREARTGRSS